MYIVYSLYFLFCASGCIASGDSSITEGDDGTSIGSPYAFLISFHYPLLCQSKTLVPNRHLIRAVRACVHLSVFAFILCPLFYCVSPIHMLAMLNSACLCLLILFLIILFIIFICPLLYCVSPMHVLAMLNSTCTITHLLSFSCTSYFCTISFFICAICECISLVV